MKISGPATDVVEISRIRKTASKKEIPYCLKSANKYERLAEKFAAKEAVIKALSDRTIRLKDIEIVNELSGRPGVRIKGTFHIAKNMFMPYVSLFEV